MLNEEDVNKEIGSYDYDNPGVTTTPDAAIENVVETKPVQVLQDPVMPKEAKTEAAQVLDTDKRNDEANNESISKATSKLSDSFENVEDLNAYLEQYYNNPEPGSSLVRKGIGMLERANTAEPEPKAGESATTAETDADYDRYYDSLNNEKSVRTVFDNAISKVTQNPEDKNNLLNKAVNSFPLTQGGKADELRKAADWIQQVAEMDGNDPNKEAETNRVYDYIWQLNQGEGALFNTYGNEDTLIKAADRFTEDLDGFARWLRWKADWTSNKPTMASTPYDLENMYQQGIITDDDIFDAVDKAGKQLGILEKDTEIKEDVQKEKDWVAKKLVDSNVTSGIDWSKVKVYKPGEDLYDKVDDTDYDPRIEENLKYDYDQGVGNPGVNIHKDEDFAGADELPDVVRQLPAEIKFEDLPAEIKKSDYSDTSDYNFEWDWEDISDEVDNDQNIPPEYKEEVKQRRVRIARSIKNKRLNSYSANASPIQSQDTDINGKSSGSASAGSSIRGLSSILGGSSASVHPSKPSASKTSQVTPDSVRSVASKAPVPPVTDSHTEKLVRSGSTNRNPRANGTVGSGTGLLLGKHTTYTAPKDTAPKIGIKGHTSTATNLGKASTGSVNSKETLVEIVKQKILQLHQQDPERLKELGISSKYKSFALDGIELTELSPQSLTDLSLQLDKELI